PTASHGVRDPVRSTRGPGRGPAEPVVATPVAGFPGGGPRCPMARAGRLTSPERGRGTPTPAAASRRHGARGADTWPRDTGRGPARAPPSGPAASAYDQEPTHGASPPERLRGAWAGQPWAAQGRPGGRLTLRACRAAHARGRRRVSRETA